MHLFDQQAHNQALESRSTQQIKNLQRQSLAMDVEAFERNGGVIQKIPTGVSGHPLSACTKVDSSGRVHITLNPNPIH